jgi:hypothetical protein
MSVRVLGDGVGASPGAKDAFAIGVGRRGSGLLPILRFAKSLKGSNFMHMSTLIVLIVLGVLLFGGGGGYYWSRRR